MSIWLKSTNKFEKTTTYFAKLKNPINEDILKKYGEKGVSELEKATPKDTGKTSKSWSYKIEKDKKQEKVTLNFRNSNENNGVPIALIIQYGHGTRNGGYVPGIDYINPALKPIFEDLKKEINEEVNRVV